MTSAEIERFLRVPHIAGLGTVHIDGGPHVTPVWYHYDGTSIKIIAEPQTVKVRNIAHDPRVALSIATQDSPYKYVLIRGLANITDEDPWQLVHIMSLKYKGEIEGPKYEAGLKNRTKLCTIHITPSRIVGWTDDS